MDAAQIQEALDWVFDQAIEFHGFTDYMRDYAVYTFSVADPSTGIRPSFDQYLFKCCVVANATTALTPEIWSRSLDDRLTSYETGVDLDGYVWGVKWQSLYPGAKVVADSLPARDWQEALGIPFHEVRINTNAHNLTLVFSDLEVTTGLPLGYAPYTVGDIEEPRP